MNEQVPSEEKYFDLRCAHGKRAYERCRQCEHDVHMGRGTGFTRKTLEMLEDAEHEDDFGD